MELVILNIGLDIKIISPALFSMMVIMALFTTFITTPVLDLLRPGTQSPKNVLDEALPVAV
jgi:Kef-type K+ transport system membrane component KefB